MPSKTAKADTLIDPQENFDDDLDDGEGRDCQTCGGDGFAECDGDCPESDDCGCPYADAHYIRCTNCRGSGAAKDQQYW